MIKITILTLALVAVLAVKASAQEETEQPAGNIDGKDASFARQLGYKLYRSCDNKDKKAFAAKLADESSDAYRCATRQLADPEALTFIFQFVPRVPEGSVPLYYLSSLGNKMFNNNNRKNFRVLLLDAKRACESYVAGTATLPTEAGTTTDSDRYENELVARSACPVLLKSDYDDKFVEKLGKYANKRYNEEVEQIKVERQRKKDYKKREELLFSKMN